MHKTRKQIDGFTIVELLIVIVVIGILATIAIVAYNNVIGRARDTAMVSSVQNIGKKIATNSLSLNVPLPANKAALESLNIKDDSSTTYQYTLNTNVNPQTFCITATDTQTGVSAHIAGNATGSTYQAVTGPCVSYGHTGNPPDLSKLTCPNDTTWIKVPGNSLFNQNHFCVMKYEAKNVSGVATSAAAGTPWVSISQTNAIARSKEACDGCNLISDNQWLTIAHNAMSVASNWCSGVVGSGFIYRGHSDNSPANSLVASDIGTSSYSGTGNSYSSACNNTTGTDQRRTLTLSNGEVIWDLAGNVYEWTTGTTQGANKQPAPSGSGYAWRQWTDTSLLIGSFADSFPRYGTPAASTWNSSQNIGQVHASGDEAGLRAFRRGGSWSTTTNAGVLTLHLGRAPSYTDSLIGFRVSR